MADETNHQTLVDALNHSLRSAQFMINQGAHFLHAVGYRASYEHSKLHYSDKGINLPDVASATVVLAEPVQKRLSDATRKVMASCVNDKDHLDVNTDLPAVFRTN